MGIHSTTWYRPRVKFCGLTRPGDVDAACKAGADFVGLVQVPNSKRYVTLETTVSLARRVRRPTKLVLLFMDADEPTVSKAVETVQPDVLQFHGNESPAFCAQFGVPWIKAIATGGRDLADVVASAQPFCGASYLLLDGHAPGEMGGSGHAVAGAAPEAKWPAPLMLAGGLDAERIGPAVIAWRPAAVDVSSGIESTPGVKDRQKMQAFLRAVANAAGATEKRGDND